MNRHAESEDKFRHSLSVGIRVQLLGLCCCRLRQS